MASSSILKLIHQSNLDKFSKAFDKVWHKQVLSRQIQFLLSSFFYSLIFMNSDQHSFIYVVLHGD